VRGVKQVIVVREDIGMSAGKLAAQCCHASVSAALKSRKIALNEWIDEGQKKIILQVSGEKALHDLKRRCDKARLASFIVSDAGFTELSPGTITALGIGPDNDKKIDKITGSLKLLK
jgi:PTH2 family peptidyl-tRNA hydrolase